TEIPPEGSARFFDAFTHSSELTRGPGSWCWRGGSAGSRITAEPLTIYAVSRCGCNTRRRLQSTSKLDYLCRSQVKGAARWRNRCRIGGGGSRIASRVQIVCAAWRHSLAS